MDESTIRALPEPPQARFSRNSICDTTKCSLYFLAGAGLIKIGITTNLTSRIRAIRNSSPVPIEVLAIIRNAGNVEEGFMHGRFADLRRHGEWFEDEGSIREHIERLVRNGRAERPQ
jgi:hypothetical protein